MPEYDELRQQYKPTRIKFLLIAESPPPSAEAQGSRHFYRTDRIRPDDRLFLNTVRALYKNASGQETNELEENKEQWLRHLQKDGIYMIEALIESQRHEVTKKDRQAKIGQHIGELIQRVGKLAGPDTGIILIKSNVFDIAAAPLREAGFNVLNTALVDYPGVYNQDAYRNKLAKLVGKFD